MTDGRVARGDRTRAAVLDGAVALATEDGLDGLSLGQLAVTPRGQQVRPVRALALQGGPPARHHRARPRAVGDARRRAGAAGAARHPPAVGAARVAGRLLRGRGPARRLLLRQRRVRVQRAPRRRCATGWSRSSSEWMALIERLVAEAIEAGELQPDVDPRQLAYEIESLGLTAVMQARLLEPEAVYAHARRAVLDRLRALPPTRPCCRRTEELTTGGLTMYGHAEPVAIHFDDLDAMGIVHNARYAVLVERALPPYWASAATPSTAGDRPPPTCSTRYASSPSPTTRRSGAPARSPCTSGSSGSARPAPSTASGSCRSTAPPCTPRAAARSSASTRRRCARRRGPPAARAVAESLLRPRSAPEERRAAGRRTPPPAPRRRPRPVVEPPVADHVPQRADRAGLRLPGAEHQRDTRASTSAPGAHRARLQRHHQRAAVQPPRAERAGGPAQRQDLGVRGRVAGQLALVARRWPARAPSGVVDDRADRDVVGSAPARPAPTSAGATASARRIHASCALAPVGRHASRSSSTSSPQPIAWHTSAVTSAGSMPSWPHSSSSRCAGTPRSASRSASPTGSASGSAAGLVGLVVGVARPPTGSTHLVDLERRRLDVAEQQRAEPGLLGERRVGAEDPQVLALVQAQDRQVGVVGLDEQQRDVGLGVDVAQPVGDVLDVGGAGEVELGGGPAGRRRAPRRQRSTTRRDPQLAPRRPTDGRRRIATRWLNTRDGIRSSRRSAGQRPEGGTPRERLFSSPDGGGLRSVREADRLAGVGAASAPAPTSRRPAPRVAAADGGGGQGRAAALSKPCAAAFRWSGASSSGSRSAFDPPRSALDRSRTAPDDDDRHHSGQSPVAAQRDRDRDRRDAPAERRAAAATPTATPRSPSRREDRRGDPADTAGDQRPAGVAAQVVSSRPNTSNQAAAARPRRPRPPARTGCGSR